MLGDLGVSKSFSGGPCPGLAQPQTPVETDIPSAPFPPLPFWEASAVGTVSGQKKVRMKEAEGEVRGDFYRLRLSWI